MNFNKTLLDEAESVCDGCNRVGPRSIFTTVYRGIIRYDFCPECVAKQVK